MSKRANPTLIGIFVTGALALLVAAILVLGSGNAFKKTRKAIMYFDGSVYGLQVGAPVVFRGVRVGTVQKIGIETDPASHSLVIPVIAEFTADQTINPFYKSEHDAIDADFDRLVSRGLRAQLDLQSLLTGQLMIEMDFYPRSQIPYPIKEVKEYDDVPEIPTIPSQFDNILQTLTTLPYDDIASNVLDITEGVKKILSNSGTEQLIGHIDKLVVQLQDIGTNLDKTLTSIRGLAEPYTKLAQDTDKRLSAALEQASHVLSRIDNVAKETDRVNLDGRTRKYNAMFIAYNGH